MALDYRKQGKTGSMPSAITVRALGTGSNGGPGNTTARIEAAGKRRMALACEQVPQATRKTVPDGYWPEGYDNLATPISDPDSNQRPHVPDSPYSN